MKLPLILEKMTRINMFDKTLDEISCYIANIEELNRDLYYQEQ